MDSDNVFYADPAEDAILRETTSTTAQIESKQPVSTWLTLAIRLPAILLADLILLHNEYLYNQICSKFEFYFNALLVSLISRFFLLLSLFICLQIFTIKLRYAVNIFKFLGLMSLPFIFKPCIDFTRRTDITIFSILTIPAPLIVIVIYSIIFTFTVLLYTEIYRHIIFDTKRTQERYHRIDYNQESVNDLLENLLDMDTNPGTPDDSNQMSPEENNAVMDEINDDCTKRRFYILAYFMASLVINEMSYFNSAQQLEAIEGKGHEDFNIISLGYIMLLFYDLTANLDQLILRFLIKVKYLGNLLSEYGFNNILSYNWFYRLRVPFLLRTHFVVKAVIFTCNFILFYNYYFELDGKIEAINKNKRHDSLVSYIESMFLNSNETLLDVPEAALNDLPSAELKSPIQFFESLQSLLNFEFIHQFSWELVTSDSVIAYGKFYTKMLVLSLSDTILSIGSMTAVLAWKFNILGKFVTNLTAIKDSSHGDNNNNNNQDEELLNVGDVSAVFFFLLSIQTGLSSLNGFQRIERLFKNYSLLFIAILHYFHTNYDSQLIQLSASSQPNWRSRKHIRLLGFCSCLILIPVVLLFLIWRNFVISTWYLAATAFCIELIVKMSVTIIQYALFMRDSQRIYSQQKKSDEGEESSDELSDKLDDHIYYVKGFGHVTEFIVAIFLFWNGVYILLFESYGGIRAIMICIHAYFHIFVQAKKGWSAFMKRRTAIEKLKRMVIFSERTFHLLETREDEYERKLHDACAICFSEIGAHETRITRCKHLFHSICLRKWLYIQDTCPMCHGVLYPNVQLTENITT